MYKMKAAFIEQHGGPEVLKYGDVPDPVAKPGEVVVDVYAASVNGADWKVRVGQHKQSRFPYVLGRDFSGVVAKRGAKVKDLKFALGINNLTNRMPPLDPRVFTDNNADVATYSPIGRLVYGTVSIGF